jgi:hypothetical protein
MIETTDDHFRQISFRLTEKERNRFLALIKGKGRDTTEVLRNYARNCVDRNEILEGSTAQPDQGGASGREILDAIEKAKVELVQIAEALALWESFKHLTDEQREVLKRAASDPFEFDFIRRMQSVDLHSRKPGRTAQPRAAG